MKNRAKMSLFGEVKELIRNFVNFRMIEDPILELPKEVKSLGVKQGYITLVANVIGLVFAYFLTVANMLIEMKLILLGILVFALYRGQMILRAAFAIYRDQEDKKYELIFNDEIVLRGSKLISLVTNKVMKFDSKTRVYKLMTNEETLSTIRMYLTNSWNQQIGHGFEFFEVISVILMIIGAIVTNTKIPQKFFIPLILTFVVISFFASAYNRRSQKIFYEKNREYDNQQSVIVNDLLRVPFIVKEDISMRIGIFQRSVEASNENVKNYNRKANWSRLIVTCLEALSQYGIIILYLVSIDWNSITVGTIAEIAATIAIFETALSYVGNLIRALEKNSERVIAMNKEEPYMREILNVYNAEKEKVRKVEPVTNIKLEPFSIRYLEESENDRPFELISNESFEINQGDVVVLTGASGSGKSTFTKMLCDQIKLDKSENIPKASRFQVFDENSKLGSFSIYDEIFCGSDNPNEFKMEDILKHLELWDEIGANCKDIWTWMKEKRFNVLSNGQKQRLVLAKLLYWQDDDIDVVVLDEATSGLDDNSLKNGGADAEKILEYVIRESNSDRKRIVILSTHQNVDNMIEKMSEDFTFKKLKLVKSGVSKIERIS